MGRPDKRERRRMRRKEKQRKARRQVQLEGRVGAPESVEEASQEILGAVADTMSGLIAGEVLDQAAEHRLREIQRWTGHPLFNLLWDLKAFLKGSERWPRRLDEISSLRSCFDGEQGRMTYDFLASLCLANEIEALKADLSRKQALSRRWPFAAGAPEGITAPLSDCLQTAEAQLPFRLLAVLDPKAGGSHRRALVKKSLAPAVRGGSGSLNRELGAILEDLLTTEPSGEGWTEELDRLEEFLDAHHYDIRHIRDYQALVLFLQAYLARPEMLGAEWPSRLRGRPHLAECIFNLPRGALSRADARTRLKEARLEHEPEGWESFLGGVQNAGLSYEASVALELGRLRVAAVMRRRGQAPERFADQSRRVLMLLRHGVPPEWRRAAARLYEETLDFLAARINFAAGVSAQRRLVQELHGQNPLDYRFALARLRAEPERSDWTRGLLRQLQSASFHHFTARAFAEAARGLPEGAVLETLREVFYRPLAGEQRKEVLAEMAGQLATLPVRSGEAARTWDMLSKICMFSEREMFPEEPDRPPPEGELLFICVAMGVRHCAEKRWGGLFFRMSPADILRLFRWVNAQNPAPGSFVRRIASEAVERLLKRLLDPAGVGAGGLEVIAASGIELNSRAVNLIGKFLADAALPGSRISPAALGRFVRWIEEQPEGRPLRGVLRKLPRLASFGEEARA